MTIQVFLPVGGENGILVKNYLKIPISPLEVFLPKYQKLHLKSERFKIKKIEVEKMVWLFQVEKMGSPYSCIFLIIMPSPFPFTGIMFFCKQLTGKSFNSSSNSSRKIALVSQLGLRNCRYVSVEFSHWKSLIEIPTSSRIWKL